MVPFPMIMGCELSDRVSQHILTEENHLIETAFFDCSDEPLRVGIAESRQLQIVWETRQGGSE